MTGPSGNRLSICPLRFRITSPRVPIDPILLTETLGEVILNLSGQIDLPITLETSHYLFTIKYKVERDKRYLPYIELGRWLCSHFQLESNEPYIIGFLRFL